MAKSNFSEIGSTGLQTFSGIINEDFLREWRGKEAYKRANEMRLNSSVVAALLLANEQAIRKVEWTFACDDENDPRLELLNDARDGMSLSWNDHITEALTMLPFGFSPFEIVYKRDKRNRVVWRKFAPRGQDTVYRWEFDAEGGLTGFWQQAAPTYQMIFLPIEKLLIYRTRVERGNPEGRSILRTAWRSYYFSKNIESIEAIGIERDLAGLPVITLPASSDTADTDTSDFGIAQKIVRNIRNDEQAGIVLPSPDWKLELLSTGGSRQFDTDKIVRRYESRILMSALAQFLNLGQESTGAYALSKDQTDFFTMSVNAVADIIAETFTKYAIPRLLQLNGFDPEGVRLEHSPAGDTDTDLLANTLQKVGSMITWTPEDEVWLRAVIGMPEADVETIEAERLKKMEQAITLAQKSKAPAQDDGEEKDDMPMRGKQAEGEYGATRFAANAPDDAKRRRMEHEMRKIVETHLAKTRRKVMSYARGADRGENLYGVNRHTEPQPTSDGGVIDMLAEALNRVTPRREKEKDEMIININNPQNVEMTSKDALAALKAMREHFETAPQQPAPVVNVHVPQQPAPVVNVTAAAQPAPVVNVQVPEQTPPIINNEITVQPAEVVVERGKREARVDRDANGRITRITSDEA